MVRTPPGERVEVTDSGLTPLGMLIRLRNLFFFLTNVIRVNKTSLAKLYSRVT